MIIKPFQESDGQVEDVEALLFHRRARVVVELKQAFPQPVGVETSLQTTVGVPLSEFILRAFEFQFGSRALDRVQRHILERMVFLGGRHVGSIRGLRKEGELLSFCDE